MKKLFAVLLVAMLALTACGKKGETETPTPAAKVKVGTGIVVTEKGTDATADAEGTYQVDTYYATVVLDGDVIKDVYIDVAQNKVSFDATDKLTKFEGKGTKKEQGDNYGMTKNPAAIAEWHVQMDAFEKWIIGQKLSDVLSMKTVAKDDAHPAVPDVEDLKSSVTITVDKYLEALRLAAENAVEVENVAKVATVSKTSASQEGVEINTTIVALAVDPEGKIVHTFIDAMQSKAELSAGVIKPAGIVNTKKQLGDDYGMATKNPSAVAEWDDQIIELEKYTIGKTVDEVVGMKTAENKVAEEDLKSKVTITVNGYLEAIKYASENLEAIK